MNQPKISIIIPIFNDAESLRGTINGLKAQSLPGNQFEIIVIDNGSSVDMSFASSDPEIIFLEELQYANSPYSCRNRGLEIARGEVVIFLDATCRPTPQWLEQGLKCLETSDLIGGNVLFDFEEEVNAAKIYDSLIYIRMKEKIERDKAAMTANLFVKKKVIDAVGKFPEGLRSGGDVRWTKIATNKGFELRFCEQATVYKKARSYWALLKKQWRVSKAHPHMWEKEGRQKPISRYFIAFLRVGRPRSIKAMIMNKHGQLYLNRLYSIWFFSIAMHFVGRTANLLYFLKLRLGPS